MAAADFEHVSARRVTEAARTVLLLVTQPASVAASVLSSVRAADPTAPRGMMTVPSYLDREVSALTRAVVVPPAPCAACDPVLVAAPSRRLPSSRVCDGCRYRRALAREAALLIRVGAVAAGAGASLLTFLALIVF